MTLARAMEWVRSHRWWVALVVVIIAGYSVGRDLAVRDSASDDRVSARGA